METMNSLSTITVLTDDDTEALDRVFEVFSTAGLEMTEEEISLVTEMDNDFEVVFSLIGGEGNE